MLIQGTLSPEFVQNTRQVYESYRHTIRISAPFFVPVPSASVSDGGQSVKFQDLELEQDHEVVAVEDLPRRKYLQDIRQHVER